ncbi:MAG: RnfABCDGE type electron transport complex subunit C [Firmicutes bacterium]|nr:RnfABCDGE type electron transport complex subunit C [Bacillota bacterium]
MGHKLSSFKKMSKGTISFYTKPKYVYIPLVSGRDKDVTLLVKKGDHVSIGSIIGKRKGNKIPIHSSVSGTVVEYVKKPYLNGEIIKCVKIENDFKEEYIEKEPVIDKVSALSKEEFLETILDKGIVGLGGSGFPTYIKYNTDKKIKTLIVNAVECEPYITADDILFKENTEEILEAVDAIMEINHIDEAIIAVKKTNTELIHIINNFIGTYLNIKLKAVDDIYPMGWERTLVRQTCHTSYKMIPLEKGIVVSNVSTVYAMYRALKYHEFIDTRIVTFTGEMLEKPCNVRVKIGTEVKEVIKSLGGYKEGNELLFIAGGPMMGTALPSDELVVTPDLNCVLVKDVINDCKGMTCMRCGKCIEVCPAKLSPVLIAEAVRKDNVDKIRKLEVERCCECGLCTYICPSKIDVRNTMVFAKQKCKEEVK